MLDLARDVGVELALGLTFKLGLRNLDRNNSSETFADVVTRKAGSRIFFGAVFKQACRSPESVDGTGEGSAETAEVGSTIHGVDVVGEAEQRFGVTVVILEGDLHGDGAAGAELLAFN